MNFRRPALLLAAAAAAASSSASAVAPPRSSSAFVVPTPMAASGGGRGRGAASSSSVARTTKKAGPAGGPVGVSAPARRWRWRPTTTTTTTTTGAAPPTAAISVLLRSSASDSSSVEGGGGGGGLPTAEASADDTDEASSSDDADDSDSSSPTPNNGSNDDADTTTSASASAAPDDDDASSSSAQTKKSAAILEAERLRSRARSLLSEAAAEEAALRSSALSRKSKSDAEYDAVISSLLAIRSGLPEIRGDDTEVVKRFESTMDETLPRWVKDREAVRVGRIRRVEAYADWIRGGRVTTSKLIKVVERIYERERIARNGRTEAEKEAAEKAAAQSTPPLEPTTGDASAEGNAAAASASPLGAAAKSMEMPPAGAGLTFNIGSSSNVAERNESELRNLDGLIDEIIDACELLDEERRPKGDNKDVVEEDGEDAAVGGANGASAVDEEKEKEKEEEKGEGSSGNGNAIRHYGVSPNSANVLRTRIKDLRRADDEAFKRRLASEIHAADRKLKQGKGGQPRKVLKGELKEGESIEDFVRRTMMAESGGNGTSLEVELTGAEGEDFDVTKLVMDVMRVPLWIPPSLLPYVVTCPDELDPVDAKRIKTDVLKGSTFACSGWDSFERGAIYRGSFVGRRAARTVAAMEGRTARTTKKEGNEGATTSQQQSKNNAATELLLQQRQQQRSEEVFAEVRSRLEQDSSGLSERVQLFLLEDPEWRPGDANDEVASGEYAGPPPVILALSKSVCPERAGERGKGAKFVAALSVVATLFTAFAYAVSSYALNPTFFDAVVRDNDVVAVAVSAVPLFLGVLALQGMHELAHVAVARARNVTLGLPVPLPSLQIGTFGSITPIRSFPETRRDMMDVALSGPGVTLLLSLAFMIGGITCTLGASEEMLATLPVVPAALFRSSFLVGSLTSVLAPKVVSLPLSQPVPVHPLFMVGLTGLVSSALNLLPVGRLDGGRAFRCAFGRRPAILVSFLFLLIMAVAALSGTSQISIFWGLIVTVFQRNGDVPPRDEVTGVDATRRGMYGALTAVALLALLPFPGGPGAL